LKFLLLILVSIFFCCNKKDSGDEPNEYAAKMVSQLNSSDSFRRDYIRINTRYEDSANKTDKRILDSSLKLSSLENGFDSIQIRIWYGCPQCKEDMFVILKNEDKSWSAQISKLKITSLDSNCPDFRFCYSYYYKNKTQLKKPRSGWKSFIDSLFNLKILSMEDQGWPPNFFPGHTDVGGMFVELATKNTYRQYKYIDPRTWKGSDPNYWKAENVIKIMRLLNKEFDIEYDYPD